MGVPVTILSGFLGSGKTTVLQNILSNKDVRVGVIVNDMGAVNVDHELTVIKQSDGVVSLANGCVCCVLRNDLLEEITTMAATGNFDAIVVECSGIAEPRQLAAMFKDKFPSEDAATTVTIAADGEGDASAPDKRTQSHIAANERHTGAGAASPPSSAQAHRPYLDNLVTVVDSENFLERIRSDKRVGENTEFRAVENASAQDNRFIVDLLTDQVEVATTLILNKVDLVTPASVEQLESIVSTYNSKATIVQAQFGCVDLSHLVQTKRYHAADFDDAGAGDATTDYSGTISGSAGITSFVWRSARPFNPTLLHNLICTLKEESVIRMKGFVCVADRNNDVTPGHQQLYLALAGNHIRLHAGRECVRHHAELSPTASEIACRLHDGCASETEGGRASELVVIGFGEEIKRMKKLLNACLVSSSNEIACVDPIMPLPHDMWSDAQKLDEKVKRQWVVYALMLAMFTVVWNIAEGVVSLYLGIEEESLSVISFGADSIIEVFSACFVLWRLSTDFGSDGDGTQVKSAAHKATIKFRERVATFCIGLLLVLLALGSIGGAIYRLEQKGEPEDGTAGIVISCLSLSFMFGLWYLKMWAAVMLKSTTLEADAACSFGCIALSFILLIGSVLFQAERSLWWVDAVSAIALSLFIGWEGYGMVRAASRKDFDGCGCVHKPSRLAKYLRSKLMTADGALKSSVVKANAVLADRMFTQSGGLPVSAVCNTKCYDCEDNVSPCRPLMEMRETAESTHSRVTGRLAELNIRVAAVCAELAALDSTAARSPKQGSAMSQKERGRVDAALEVLATQLRASTSMSRKQRGGGACASECCTHLDEQGVLTAAPNPTAAPATSPANTAASPTASAAATATTGPAVATATTGTTGSHGGDQGQGTAAEAGYIAVESAGCCGGGEAGSACTDGAASEAGAHAEDSARTAGAAENAEDAASESDSDDGGGG